MTIADAVPLYLTILMVVLSAIALIGGHKQDQLQEQQGGSEKEDA